LFFFGSLRYYLTEALSAPLQRTKKATTTTTTGTKDKATKARNLPPKEECAQLALEAAEAYLIAVRTRATKKAAQQGVGGVWNAGRAELGTCHNNVGFLLKVTSVGCGIGHKTNKQCWRLS
jgi:hypothetical protein